MDAVTVRSARAEERGRAALLRWAMGVDCRVKIHRDVMSVLVAMGTLMIRMYLIATLFFLSVTLAVRADEPISPTLADDAVVNEELSRGRTPLGKPGEDRTGYRKSWAFIIGINYDDPARSDRDRLVLPKLKNAERDARALRELLISHYGYAAENIIYNETGADATHQWMRESLRRLCDPNEVSPEDSLLVFFAGHGDRLESTKDQGALFPYDVQFGNGRPIANTYLRVHSDLSDIIETSPARHKLVILDSCYSGEIFNIGARPSSDFHRDADALFEMPCMQAMTSCRASQVASDGPGANSPFTESLLKSLQQLPARHVKAKRIWTNWLFAYMQTALPNGQTPDCRNLTGDGEFSFFPNRKDAQLFEEFLPTATDYQMLQVSAGSEQGLWWFDETPWFLPSLREEILQKLEADRSGIANMRLSRVRIKEAARSWQASSQNASANKANNNEQGIGPIVELRRKHLGMLLDESGKSSKKRTLETIVADLSADEVASDLEPEDLHLLAIAQHGLSLPEAAVSYQRAIEGYEGSAAGNRSTPNLPPEEVGSTRGDAMLALCKADFGQYFNENSSHQSSATEAHTMAARYFREAFNACHLQGPASFQIFVLCREADSWEAINRWADARECHERALATAVALDPNHYLAAFVHREMAWARMMEWKIGEAELSFAESNRILANWMGEAVSADAEATSASQHAEETPGYQPEFGELDIDAAFVIDPKVKNSNDQQARIAYFHNLHGLAMAQRFHARTAIAAAKYRHLAMEWEHALGQLRQTSGASDSSIEMHFVNRQINTLERLADCNLFGDPAVRDLSEALDDYERSAARIHWLEKQSYERSNAQLMYKRALVLCQESSVQDSELAVEMCKQADAIYAEEKLTASGLYQSLGVLTTPTVNLMAASPKVTKALQPLPEALASAREELRKTLYSYRAKLGSKPHRDQLELCLFASDILVQYGEEENPLLKSEDVDLLLSFCRIPLSPYQHFVNGQPVMGDSRGYLRPYYDTAMTALVDTEGRTAKKLLRLHWEATRGSICPKPELPVPVIALYLLRGEPYLLYSLPNGPSSTIRLGEDFSSTEIIAACHQSPAKALPLPRRVDQAFESWRMEHAGTKENSVVDIRLCPELVPRETRNLVETSQSDEQPTEVTKVIRSRFPFMLPSGFAVSAEPAGE